VLEFLIAGATAVGIGTALFYDPMICKKINAGLLDYMEQHHLASIHKIVGSLKL
jgi:dihydroorotate dehydrogenase (NAD+) catalytic subunit